MFSGTFNPGTQKTEGKIGKFDYGGSKEDVLLGTYGAGQDGATTPYSFVDAYFPGWGGWALMNWGWTYRYRSQPWNNYDYDTTGDIVV